MIRSKDYNVSLLITPIHWLDRKNVEPRIDCKYKDGGIFRIDTLPPKPADQPIWIVQFKSYGPY